jgi:hypothetical protein
LINGPQLCLEPINMLFGIDDHVFEQMPGRKIIHLGTVGYAFSKQLHIVELKLKIRLEEVPDRRSYPDLVDMPYLRRTLQI